MSTFYKIFWRVIAVAVAVVIVGLVFLRFVLADYESSIAVNVANRLFTAAEEGRFNEFVDENSGSRFESADSITAACQQAAAGKKLDLLNAGGSDKESTFVVRGDEKRLITFTVVRSDKTSTFGFTQYRLGRVKYSFAASYTVSAPADYTVSVNGVALGEADRGEEKAGEKPLDLPEGITPLTFVTYKVDNLLAVPTVTATDGKGNTRVAVLNEEDRCFTVEPIYSEALQKEYASYCIAATESYATYMADDGYFGMITKYFEPGTDTYQYISDTIVSFVWDHNSFKFTDQVADRFYAYSDDVFTCRVRMNQNLYLAGKEPYVDPIDLTLCMHRVKGKFMVYSVKTNG